MAINDTLNAELNPGFRSNKTWKRRPPGEPATPQFLWNRRNQEKLTAHAVVRAALRSGEIKRGPCEICGSSIVDAHHDDYGQPLVVRWLCRRDHQQLHAALRRAA